MHSFIYKWNGSKFMLFQSIPTRGGDALYPFVICGQTYITAINHHEGEKNVERLSTTSDMCTSPLETTLSHTEKFLPKRRWLDITVTTSDFPNQLYLLLQRNRKQIQDKQQVVEVDHTTDPISARH